MTIGHTILSDVLLNMVLANPGGPRQVLEIGE